MLNPFAHKLSRREREILGILFRLNAASVADVRAALPDPPGYSSVRALLRILEEKGHARHVEEGGKYLYSPVETHASAAGAALRQVIDNFFAGSVEGVVATLLTEYEANMSEDEFARLAEMIERAKVEEAGHVD